MASKSSGANCLGMNSIFSTPMPCSAVTLPPQAMHSARISRPACQHAGDLLGIALVEEQNRMHVAVAGVGDVDDAQAVLPLDLGDAARACAAAGCAARRRPAMH